MGTYNVRANFQLRVNACDMPEKFDSLVEEFRSSVGHPSCISYINRLVLSLSSQMLKFLKPVTSYPASATTSSTALKRRTLTLW